MSRFAPHYSFRPRALTALAVGLLATAASFGSPTVATADQPSTDARQTIVYYSFGDLTTEQGRQGLYKRIVRAAQTVCASYDTRSHAALAEARECQQQAVTRTVHQIGDARLAAVHRHALARRG